MTAGERNIKLIIEYDGTPYCGFQVQDGMPTVQAELEQALFRIVRKPVRVVGAGRTDSGVHARGQVVNFKVESRLSAPEFKRALNAVLPRDISVLEAEEVGADFDARRSARGKIYLYRIHNREAKPALEYNRCWHVKRPLDLEAMTRAAGHLIGKHDFSAFRSASCAAKNPVREMRRIDISRPEPGEILIEVEATAFLKQMVRTIVGTLVEVGLGRLEPDDVAGILKGQDRTRAGVTAPARGLCLMRVLY